MDLAKEQQLIYRAQSDPGCFGELHEEYYLKIFRYAFRRTGDICAAEDITSQTFFKALKICANSAGAISRFQPGFTASPPMRSTAYSAGDAFL
jgi:DNA-directed RNA polymerase specialized sigma24 family protein